MILNDIVLYDNFFMMLDYKDNFMSKGPYQTFANRLISTLKEKGYSASRSPNGICIKTLAEFTGASEQI
ncbi:transcriptional regulator, partial [Legionella pneumophila]